jgi:hypothetical protein
MIGIDRARRLDLVVKWAANLVVGSERQADQVGQRRDIVRQASNEIFVIFALDQRRIVDRTDVVTGVVEIDVERRLEHELVGIALP